MVKNRFLQQLLLGLVAVFETNAAGPVISSPTNFSVTPGVTVAYQITASNSPTSFNASSLPTAWTIDRTNGVVLGQIGQTGMVGSNYTFNVTAANAQGTSAPVAVTFSVTASAAVSQQYRIGAMPASTSTPVPFWVSQPVLPDDTVLVTGGQLTNTTTAQLAPLDNGPVGEPQLPVLGFLPWGTVTPGTLTSRSLHVGIPASWSPGIYALRLGNGGTNGPAILINAPDPWFAMGDSEMEATPGGTLYVAGHCLSYPGQTTTVALVQNGVAVATLTGSPLTSDERGWGYAVTATLPAVPLGLYEVWVHNGLGGSRGWAKVADPLSIIPAFTWPAATVDFDAMPGANDDAKMAAAMTALGRAGGTVLLPARTLNFAASLALTNWCRLKGQGKTATTLSFAANCTSPLIGSWYNDIYYGRTFALEDLKIYAPAGYPNIAVQRAYQHQYPNQQAYLPGWMKRVDVQLDAPPVSGVSGGGGSQSSAVWLRQTADFAMEDCTFDSPMPVSGVDTVFGVRMSRCTLHWRDSSFFLRGMTSHVLVNDCTFNLRGDPTNNFWINATNPNPGIWFGAFKAGSNSIGGQYIKNVLLANCVHTRDDHSYPMPGYVGYTSDGETSIYTGPFSANATNVTLPNPTMMLLSDGHTLALYDWAGCRASIVQGAGAGQHRTVVLGATQGQTNLVIDRAWDVAPDATSIIDIGCQVGNTLMISNDWSEARLIQYYFNGVNNTLAGGNIGSSDGQATVCNAWSGYHYEGWFQAAQMQFLSSQNRFGQVLYRNITADFNKKPDVYPYYVSQASFVVRDQRETNGGYVTANLRSGIPNTNSFIAPARDVLVERFPGPVTYSISNDFGGSFAVRLIDTNGTSLPSTAVRLSDTPYAAPLILLQDFATWATAFALATNSTALDHDADGIPNLLEYALGSDPTRLDSRPPISFTTGNGNFVYRYSRPTWVTNLTYTLQTSGDLTTWSNAVPQPSVGTITYTNQTWSSVIPLNQSRSFFRLSVSSP